MEEVFRHIFARLQRDGHSSQHCEPLCRGLGVLQQVCRRRERGPSVPHTRSGGTAAAPRGLLGRARTHFSLLFWTGLRALEPEDGVLERPDEVRRLLRLAAGSSTEKVHPLRFGSVQLGSAARSSERLCLVAVEAVRHQRFPRGSSGCRTLSDNDEAQERGRGRRAPGSGELH